MQILLFSFCWEKLNHSKLLRQVNLYVIHLKNWPERVGHRWSKNKIKARLSTKSWGQLFLEIDTNQEYACGLGLASWIKHMIQGPSPCGICCLCVFNAGVKIYHNTLDVVPCHDGNQWGQLLRNPTTKHNEKTLYLIVIFQIYCSPPD